MYRHINNRSDRSTDTDDTLLGQMAYEAIICAMIKTIPKFQINIMRHNDDCKLLTLRLTSDNFINQLPNDSRPIGF